MKKSKVYMVNTDDLDAGFSLPGFEFVTLIAAAMLIGIILKRKQNK